MKKSVAEAGSKSNEKNRNRLTRMTNWFAALECGWVPSKLNFFATRFEFVLLLNEFSGKRVTEIMGIKKSIVSEYRSGKRPTTIDPFSDEVIYQCAKLIKDSHEQVDIAWLIGDSLGKTYDTVQQRARKIWSIHRNLSDDDDSFENKFPHLSACTTREIIEGNINVKNESDRMCVEVKNFVSSEWILHGKAILPPVIVSTIKSVEFQKHAPKKSPWNSNETIQLTLNGVETIDLIRHLRLKRHALADSTKKSILDQLGLMTYHQLKEFDYNDCDAIYVSKLIDHFNLVTLSQWNDMMIDQ